jgi:SAM-dependent methyltransferase
MKLSILGRLCCPICRHNLTATTFKGGDDDLETGVLLCEGCDTWYPVANRVSVLLDFPTAFHASFEKLYAIELRPFAAFKKPSGKPRPGEIAIQKTFSDEWNVVQNSGLSFSYAPKELAMLHRDVYLKWLRSEDRPRNLLNIGCGLGRETVALLDAIGEPKLEAFAIDINFALIQSGEVYKDHPNLHLFIASLFKLPFTDEARFDLVDSTGVLHHTYSTEAAFNAIANYVRPGGKLFVWVYGIDDHLAVKGFRCIARRIMWSLEHILRPVLSRSPRVIRDDVLAAITTAAHPVIRRVPSVKRHLDWCWINTNHIFRDILTPVFARRHTYNEVFEWFEDAGFRIIDVQSPAAYRRLFPGGGVFGIGVTGVKVS